MSKKIEILVVDDDALARQALRNALEPVYQVHAVADAVGAHRIVEKSAIDLCVLDLHLAGASGLEILDDWRVRHPDLDVVMCSGESKVEKAIECLRRGASDYVVKPFLKEDVRWIVRRVLENRELRYRAEKLRPLLQPHPVPLVGSSPAYRDVMEKVARLRGQEHVNVLILGESGTGKEGVARRLHEQEHDPDRPFVVVNTPAIPVSLMESELFGNEKGAFTDAKTARPGKFELADGGDLFLDEIGDLPFETQAKILRALQERQVERVGSSRVRKVRFRLVSATNQPLSELMAKGRFREDLLYRLSDVVLWIPPLRERPEDIPALAQHFIAKYARTAHPPRLSEHALEYLKSYHWPGNVRQLESTIKRALIFEAGATLEKVEIYDPASFDRRARGVREPTLTYGGRLEEFERKLIFDTIQKHRGDRTAARQELGLSRATFYRKLKPGNAPGLGPSSDTQLA